VGVGLPRVAAQRRRAGGRHPLFSTQPHVASRGRFFTDDNLIYHYYRREGSFSGFERQQTAIVGVWCRGHDIPRDSSTLISRITVVIRSQRHDPRQEHEIVAGQRTSAAAATRCRRALSACTGRLRLLSCARRVRHRRQRLQPLRSRSKTFSETARSPFALVYERNALPCSLRRRSALSRPF
jgi:hypothetical protein